MGLDVSHGCWSGAYSNFHGFRSLIAKSLGFDLDSMAGFSDECGESWGSITYDDFHILLNHSDCDGEIDLEDSVKLRDRMVEYRDTFFSFAGEVTHRDRIFRVDDNTRYKYDSWISGLSDAIDSGDIVEFS